MRTGFDGRYPEDAWEAVRGTAAAPESLSGLLLLEKGARSREAGEMWPSWIGAEADRVSRRLGKVRREGDAVLFLLADTHYTMGCTWPETVQSLRVMKERVRPSGIIHLGDVTDGMLSEKWTSRFAERVLGDLRSLGVPFDGCLGNHDSNYFRGNTHAMPKDRCAEMYLGRKTPYAYRDLPEVRMRMIFLDTFDQARDQRYGFSDEEIPWLSRVLKQVPEG